MATSPTQRSLKLLRDGGYTAQVVEKWNPHAMIRQDLFGFIDIIAVRDQVEHVANIAGIQTTSRSNMSARIKKIKESEEAKRWHRAGGDIYVHGWAKNKSNRWELKAVRMDYDAASKEWTVTEE
jgi:hypothetical protein